jgi:hypothetical protein
MKGSRKAPATFKTSVPPRSQTIHRRDRGNSFDLDQS